MNRKPVVNIGVQRFDKLRKQGSFYIDKTDFIREWWETGSDVTLITRPRRFGKTLNMSMLECFFSRKYEGRADLFEGLSIFGSDSDKEKYRNLQGKFPVIFLTFANIKADKYSEMENKITEVISNLYDANDYLLEGDCLNANEKEYYRNIKIGMPSDIAVGAIHKMACFMQRYYKENVIIILDEYDTPMQEAWLSGYWDKAVSFFSSFFNATFKTNPYLERGMITGITRIAKESIFTGMNNLDVITTTSDEYATAFGFTEEEVFDALDDMGFGSEKGEVKKWYDGFTFGSYTDIYNPWSISSFIKKNGKSENYWADTSSNGLV
ncbi:MAG: AAA family ATPase, partial [Lachnospiraceae bacterium]|nr:AAA family ATPase [Lachnospiraceae bacterium]